MPRYFFTVTDDRRHSDPDGDVLADDDMARRSALAIMSETLSERSDHIIAGGRYAITVTDEGGRQVWTLTLRGSDD